jgi:hypothetical protein
MKMKTIKPMYLFFDHLYESKELIGDDVLRDWSHKEHPELKYCVLFQEDAEQDVMSTQHVLMADTHQQALHILEEEAY